MVRLIKTLFPLSIGAWVSVVAVQPLAAQQSVDLPGDTVWIADFGLESQIPSAIDLVGPEHGSAGRNRAALVHRIQCWIDGVESCSVVDRNDPRVRAIRRFLGMAPVDRHGAVLVHFPDQTRIEVRLVRASNLDDDAWARSAYELAVLPDTALAPGLPTVPSRLDQFEGLDYEGAPAVRAALERLKHRLKTPDESAQTRPATDR